MEQKNSLDSPNPLPTSSSSNFLFVSFHLSHQPLSLEV